MDLDFLRSDHFTGDRTQYYKEMREYYQATTLIEDTHYRKSLS